MRGQKSGKPSKIGQVWEEMYDEKSSIFLVIGEGIITRLSGEESPSYKLLDLETGEPDEVVCMALKKGDSCSWRRIA